MLSTFNPLRLCRFRVKNLIPSAREFNRSTKPSKFTLKRNGDVPAETDSVAANLGLKCLVKPFIFTVSFSGSCFVAATIWQYEEMRRISQHFLQTNWVNKFDHYTPRYKRLKFRSQLHEWWHSQTEGQKIALVITGINLFVFCLWRIPSCYPMMRKYFCASPALEATCLPMVLSTFSHYSFFHLAANMYVLYSFSTTAVAFFGKEQFLAVYGSAGVISSFTSYMHKIATGRLVTSLGASGALMAILSSVCIQYPDSLLQIVFLPFFTFSAGHALKAVMALDLVGMFAKWKLFDHAAHLGGAIFGIAYLAYGQQYIWSNREQIFDWYHKIRERGT